jgi:hypothetical protein
MWSSAESAFPSKISLSQSRTPTHTHPHKAETVFHFLLGAQVYLCIFPSYVQLGLLNQHYGPFTLSN